MENEPHFDHELSMHLFSWSDKVHISLFAIDASKNYEDMRHVLALDMTYCWSDKGHISLFDISKGNEEMHDVLTTSWILI